MRGWPKHLLVLLLAVPAVLLVSGCNDNTDDPEVSESQLLVGAVNPSVACAATEGQWIDTDGDGTSETVFVDFLQTFTFENRTRGAVLSAGSKWNDAHLDHVDITYELAEGALASRANVPVDVTVKANSTATLSVVTVPALYAESFNPVFGAPPNQGVNTRGVVRLAFRGADAAGNPVAVSTAVDFGTYTTCVAGR